VNRERKPLLAILIFFALYTCLHFLRLAWNFGSGPSSFSGERSRAVKAGFINSSFSGSSFKTIFLPSGFRLYKEGLAVAGLTLILRGESSGFFGGTQQAS